MLLSQGPHGPPGSGPASGACGPEPHPGLCLCLLGFSLCCMPVPSSLYRPQHLQVLQKIVCQPQGSDPSLCQEMHKRHLSQRHASLLGSCAHITIISRSLVSLLRLDVTSKRPYDKPALELSPVSIAAFHFVLTVLLQADKALPWHQRYWIKVVNVPVWTGSDYLNLTSYAEVIFVSFPVSILGSAL